DGHTDEVVAIKFSHDGKFIVTASMDKTARLWEASTGELQRVLREHTGWVEDAAFSRNGKLLLTVSRDSTVRVWQVSTGTPVAKLAVVVPESWVMPQAEFSADGKWVLTADGETARVWDARTGKALVELRGPRPCHSVFSPDGKLVASTERVWKADTG